MTLPLMHPTSFSNLVLQPTGRRRAFRFREARSEQVENTSFFVRKFAMKKIYSVRILLAILVTFISCIAHSSENLLNDNQKTCVASYHTEFMNLAIPCIDIVSSSGRETTYLGSTLVELELMPGFGSTQLIVSGVEETTWDGVDMTCRGIFLVETGDAYVPCIQIINKTKQPEIYAIHLQHSQFDYLNLLDSWFSSYKITENNESRKVRASSPAVDYINYSPYPAILTESLTITAYGISLYSSMAAWVSGCEGMVNLGGTSTRQQFRCIPTTTGTGIKDAVIKDRSGGTELKHFSVIVVDNQPVIDSVNYSPKPANLGESVTITATGNKLTSSMAAWVSGCHDMVNLGGSSSTQRFRCTLINGTGLKDAVVKDQSGGKELKRFTVNVVQGGPVVNSVSYSPSPAELGQLLTLTVNGSGLLSTMAAWISGCHDMVNLGGSSSTQQFRCTLVNGTGLKDAVVKDQPGGKELKRFTVNVVQGGPVVNSVSYSPNPAELGQLLTLTVNGGGLPSTTAAWVSGCQDMINLGGSSSARQFSCTLFNGTGLKDAVIKDQPGGKEMKRFTVNVVQSSTEQPIESNLVEATWRSDEWCNAECAQEIVDYARLSEAVYDVDDTSPPNYQRVKDQRLREQELCTKHPASTGSLWDISCHQFPLSGVHLSVYEKDTGEIVMAFEGTHFLSIPDWVTNFAQFIYPIVQYEEALQLAKEVVDDYGSERKIVVTGHSLGGGLAQYIALSFGLEAYTFNSAGLWGNTIDKANENASANGTHIFNITNFVAANEVCASQALSTGMLIGVNTNCDNAEVRDVVSLTGALVGKTKYVRVDKAGFLALHGMKNMLFAIEQISK